MAVEDKNGWVLRVLGVDVASHVTRPDPAVIWRTAKEAVDERLSALAGKLRETGDPDLARIADLGLFGLTDGTTGVGLAKALMEYGGAVPDRRPAAAAALRKAVGAYRTVLDGDAVIGLVDENPFGVAVGLRRTLGNALKDVEAALA